MQLLLLSSFSLVDFKTRKKECYKVFNKGDSDIISRVTPKTVWLNINLTTSCGKDMIIFFVILSFNLILKFFKSEQKKLVLFTRTKLS